MCKHVSARRTILFPRIRAALTLVSLTTLTVISLAAFAALPAMAAKTLPNDNLANAKVITALPFQDTLDMTLATAESGETECGATSSTRTVWYSFTPTAPTGVSPDVWRNSSPGKPDMQFAVYQLTGSGYAGLQLLGCSSYTDAPSFALQAGKTYLFQAYQTTTTATATLVFNLTQAPPPGNDNFANAAPLALSTAYQGIWVGATREPGEPVAPCAPQLDQTLWWSYTAPADQTVLIRAANVPSNQPRTVAIFTGSALANLALVTCDSGANGTLFPQPLHAGMTYYFQLGAPSVEDIYVRFVVFPAPPPSVSYTFTPPDPSFFDDVQFTGSASDPANLGIASETWNFGDGTTGSGANVAHQFKKDGSYSVSLTATTTDNRSATVTQVVAVSTHNVKIQSLSVPNTARGGQAYNITASIENDRYPEQVQVDLYRRNAAGGFDLVGTLVQGVPVGQATSFAFSYTFTSDDAALGSVRFQAIATILGFRDAKPNDNQLTSGTTTVH